MVTGELTLAPFAGLVMLSGNPQRAAGGGSAAGGTIEVLAGGVGVTGQLATFFGSPEQPAQTESKTPIASRHAVRVYRPLLPKVFCPRMSPLRCSANLVEDPASESGQEPSHYYALIKLYGP